MTGLGIDRVCDVMCSQYVYDRVCCTQGLC